MLLSIDVTCRISQCDSVPLRKYATVFTHSIIKNVGAFQFDTSMKKLLNSCPCFVERIFAFIFFFFYNQIELLRYRSMGV